MRLPHSRHLAGHLYSPWTVRSHSLPAFSELFYILIRLHGLFCKSRQLAVPSYVLQLHFHSLSCLLPNRSFKFLHSQIDQSVPLWLPGTRYFLFCSRLENLSDVLQGVAGWGGGGNNWGDCSLHAEQRILIIILFFEVITQLHHFSLPFLAITYSHVCIYTYAICVILLVCVFSGMVI